MKVVVLAGGFGTRLSEETGTIPKPMVMVGPQPIIWHICKHFSFYGYNEFIICCGYKKQHIYDYFINYNNNNSNIQVDLETNTVRHLNSSKPENWNVTLVDTGIGTLTANRLLAIRNLIGEDEKFFITYGDGIGNINLHNLYQHHCRQEKLMTVTGKLHEDTYGLMEMKDQQVTHFAEKPKLDRYVNIGYFVAHRDVFNYFNNSAEMLESGPIPRIVKANELSCYVHDGYWSSMDTLSDKKRLNNEWEKGNPQWKTW